MRNRRWNDSRRALLCRSGSLPVTCSPGEAIMEMEQVPGFRSGNPYSNSFEPEATPRAASSIAGVEPEDDDDGAVPPLRFPLENSVERRRGEDAGVEARLDGARQR